MPGTMLLVLGVAGLFAGIVLVVVVAGQRITERQAVGRSLAAIDTFETAQVPARVQELNRPFTARVIAPTTNALARLGRRLTPAQRTDALRRRLELAGSPPGWTVDRVLAVKVLLLLAFGVLGFVLPNLLNSSLVWRIVIIIAFPVFGYFLPDLLLKNSADKRSARIQRELPDALDMLTISVEAGLAFDAALAQVARNTEGPVAEEFMRVLSEMQIGRGRVDAFRAMAERTNVEDVKTFVSAMSQADTFGIPIANVLRVQSKEMRIKRRQRAEERAQKVPVKILFPVIFCIFPLLMIVLIGPAIISIYRVLIPTFGG